MKCHSKKKVYKCLLVSLILFLILRLRVPPSLVYTYLPPSQQEDTQHTLSEAELATTSPGITMWMDLPNAFPWRHCLQEYNNIISILNCQQVDYIEATLHFGMITFV